MANRFFNQFGGTLERKVIKLFAKINFVAGAPVLVTSEVINAGTSPVTVNPSQGIESISSPGAGRVKIVLGSYNGGVPSYDTYSRLLSVNTAVVGTISANNIISSLVSDDNVDGASGNPSLEITFIASGAGPGPGFPDNGQVLLVEITLSNSTAY